MSIVSHICIGCGKTFLAYKSSNRKFCSQSCSSTWNNIHNLTGWNTNREKHLIEIKNRGSPHDVLIHKYGDIEGEKRWLEMKHNCSINTPKDSNAKWRFIAKYGEIDGEERYLKYLENIKRWNNIQKTTTPEERFGKERALEVHNKISIGGQKRLGEKNGSFGIPRYPIFTFYPELGHKVRSGWEADVGIFLKKNHIEYSYEKRAFPVICNEKSMTYTPDFWLSPNMVIEVKGMMYESNFIKFLNILGQYPTIFTILISEYLPKEYEEKIKCKQNVYMIKYSKYKNDLINIINGEHKCQ